MSNGQHMDHLSSSVSSTPSSSVQPAELSLHGHNSHNHHEPVIHGQQNIVGDMSIDGSDAGGYQNSTPTNGTGTGNDIASGSQGRPTSKPGSEAGTPASSKQKDKRERLRSRACVACHTGKTRCSDSLPCQSCIRRGISSSCAYPDPLDPNSSIHESAPRVRRQQQQQNTQPPQQPPPTSSVFSATPTTQVRGFYSYDNSSGGGPGFTTTNGTGTPVMTAGQAAAAAVAAAAVQNMRREPSPSGPGRPSKKAKYRNLSDQEVALFTQKSFKRGTFYVGESAPVSIDPRLPLRLLLADEERVDFFVGDGIPP